MKNGMQMGYQLMYVYRFVRPSREPCSVLPFFFFFKKKNGMQMGYQLMHVHRFVRQSHKVDPIFRWILFCGPVHEK